LEARKGRTIQLHRFLNMETFSCCLTERGEKKFYSEDKKKFLRSFSGSVDALEAPLTGFPHKFNKFGLKLHNNSKRHGGKLDKLFSEI